MAARKALRRVAAVALLTVVTAPLLHSEPQTADPAITSLDDGWEYRLGDSTATAESAREWDETDWRSMTLPGWPTERSRSGYLQQRVRLPDREYRDAVVFVPAVFQHMEAYLDGALVYRTGALNAPEELEFEALSWHLIDLPERYPGSQLTFRIYSDYYLEGLGGRVLLGSRADIYQWMVRRDVDRLATASICAFIALVGLAVYLRLRRMSAVIYLVLFALLAGIYVAHYAYVKELVAPGGMAWTWLWIVAVFLMPVGIFGFVLHAVARGRAPMVKGLLLGHVGFVAVALPVGAVFPVTAGNIVLILLRVLYVAYMILLLGSVGARALRGNVEARIFLVGTLLLSAFGLRDVLIALGVVPWYRTILHYGMLCFVGALVIIVGRHLMQLYRDVRRYSEQLEEMATEREYMIGELHDGVSGLMTNINLIAEMERRSPPTERHGDSFATVATLSRAGLVEIRRFMRSLDAEERDWPSLAAELRVHGLEILEPHGIALDTTIEIDANAPPPDSTSYLNLSRICSEAVTNIVKHAGASRVAVAFTVTPAELRLVLRDDGAGFDGEAAHHGRGLASMRRRAREMGGSLEVSAKAEDENEGASEGAGVRGTTLRLKVPLGRRDRRRALRFGRRWWGPRGTPPKIPRSGGDPESCRDGR